LVKLKLPPPVFFFLRLLAFTEMPLQFTVKHTFIDDFSSDSEEECASLVKPVRTCPSVIITPPVCSEEEFSTPTCNGSEADSMEDDEVDGEAFFSVKTMNSYSPHPAKQQRLREMRTRLLSSAADSEDEADGETVFYVKTMNSYSPHPAKQQRLRLLSKDILTPVEDSPVGQFLAGKEQQCVCGHVFMPDAKFCCKCGKERCCQAAAPVQQVFLPCLLPVMPLVASAAEARPPSFPKPHFVEEVEDEMSTEERQPEMSQGALLHTSGTCKPCGFYWKSQGCDFGKDCLHCHLCPKGELKNRIRKAKRSARKAELKAGRKQNEQEK
jgi:hypothetical protein